MLKEQKIKARIIGVAFYLYNSPSIERNVKVAVIHFIRESLRVHFVFC